MKFEELYNKSRQDQKFLLDEELMWNDIESRLKKPKKKRRFFWLWFALGILLYNGYLAFFQNSENSTERYEMVADSKENVLNPSSSSSSSSSSSVKQAQAIENKSSTNLQEYISRIEVSYPSPNLSNESSPISDTVQDFRLLEQWSGAITDEHESLTKLEIPSINNSSSIYFEDKKPTTKESIIASTKDRSVRSTIKSILALPLVTTIRNYKIVKPHFDPKITLTPMIPSLQSNHGEFNSGMWYVDFSIDYLFTTNTIIEKNPQALTWAKLHESSKSKSAAFQFNSTLKYRDKSGLGLGIGILYRQISEWYDGVEVEMTTVPISSDSASFAIVNGLKVYKSGTLTQTEIYRTNYHTPIRRRYFDVPLEINYARSVNKFDVEIYLAYDLNIIHHYSGRSYASSSEILLDQNQLDQGKIYKRGFVNSARTGFKINHRLTSNISAGLSLNYWHQLSSSLNESNSVEDSYRGLGVGFLFRRKLR